MDSDIINNAPLVINKCNYCIIPVLRELHHEHYTSSSSGALCGICANEITGAHRQYHGNPILRDTKLLNLCNKCRSLADVHRCTNTLCDGLTTTRIIEFREQLSQYRALAYDVLAHMRVAGLIVNPMRTDYIGVTCVICNGPGDKHMRTYIWHRPGTKNCENITTYSTGLCGKCHAAVCTNMDNLYTCGRVLLTTQLLPVTRNICLYICEYVRELLSRHAADIARVAK